MEKYKVVLRRWRFAGGKHRPQNWRASWNEFHLLEASSSEEAIVKARELADWVYKELPAGEVVELHAIYELPPPGAGPRAIPIAIRF